MSEINIEDIQGVLNSQDQGFDFKKEEDYQRLTDLTKGIQIDFTPFVMTSNGKKGWFANYAKARLEIHILKNVITHNSDYYQYELVKKIKFDKNIEMSILITKILNAFKALLKKLKQINSLSE